MHSKALEMFPLGSVYYLHGHTDSKSCPPVFALFRMLSSITLIDDSSSRKGNSEWIVQSKSSDMDAFLIRPGWSMIIWLCELMSMT
jgi:hypothetical protein